MILIRRQGAAAWHTPTVTSYDNEQAMQRIVDLIGVSTEGAITVVECKLRTNSEIRRSVVG